jgi:hypothetical protein
MLPGSLAGSGRSTEQDCAGRPALWLISCAPAALLASKAIHG